MPQKTILLTLNFVLRSMYQVDLTRLVIFFAYKQIALKGVNCWQTPYTIAGFFLAMTMYPDVLKKAQTEVDVVVGNKRLPTMEDRGALPYVNAICMELLRWNVLVPMRTYRRSCAFLHGTTLYDTSSAARHHRRYHLRRVFDPQRDVSTREHLVRVSFRMTLI